MVLEKLQAAARTLSPLQRPSLIAVVALAAVFALSVFEVGAFAGDAYLIPSLVGVLWLLSLYSFIVCFRSLPAGADAGAGWLTRLGRTLLRGVYWLVALVLLGVTASVLWLSLRFFKVYFSQ